MRKLVRFAVVSVLAASGGPLSDVARPHVHCCSAGNLPEPNYLQCSVLLDKYPWFYLEFSPAGGPCVHTDHQ